MNVFWCGLPFPTQTQMGRNRFSGKFPLVSHLYINQVCDRLASLGASQCYVVFGTAGGVSEIVLGILYANSKKTALLGCRARIHEPGMYVSYHRTRQILLRTGIGVGGFYVPRNNTADVILRAPKARAGSM